MTNILEAPLWADNPQGCTGYNAQQRAEEESMREQGCRGRSRLGTAASPAGPGPSPRAAGSGGCLGPPGRAAGPGRAAAPPPAGPPAADRSWPGSPGRTHRWRARWQTHGTLEGERRDGGGGESTGDRGGRVKEIEGGKVHKSVKAC